MIAPRVCGATREREGEYMSGWDWFVLWFVLWVVFMAIAYVWRRKTERGS